MEACSNSRTVKRVLIALCLLMSLFVGCTTVIEDSASSPVASATPGTYEDKIVITWDKVSGVSDYEVYRSSTNSDNFGDDYISIVQTSSLSYEDKYASLAPGKIYYYKVRSVKGSTKSLPKSAAPGWLKVPTLQNVDVSQGVDTAKISVTWKVPDRIKIAAELGLTGYARIYYSDNAKNVTSATSTNTSSCSYTDVTLENLKNSEGTDIIIARDNWGKEYFFKTQVIIANDGKQSKMTALDTGWTAISSPTNVTASRDKNYISISWDKAYGVETYNIYKDKDDKDPIVRGLASSVTSFDWTAAEIGVEYRFKVTSVKDGTETGLNSDYDALDTSGVYKNLGYTVYKQPAINSITTDSANFVRINVHTTLAKGSDLRVQLYRDNVELSNGSAVVADSGDHGEVVIEDNATSGLLPGKKYVYTAVVYRNSSGAKIGTSKPSVGKIGWSSIDPPSSISVTKGEDSILTIMWPQITNSKYYTVYRSEGSEFSQISTLTANEASDQMSYMQNNNNIETGKVYYYRVRSRNDIESADSETDSGWIRISAPSKFVSEGIYDDYVKLVWNTVRNAKSYILYRKTYGSSDPYIAIDTVDYPATTYQDTGLAQATQYSYQIQAVSKILNSLDENEKSTTFDITSTAKTALKIPVLDSVSQNLPDRIKLYWESVPGQKYYIYYLADNGGWVNVGNISDSTIALTPGGGYLVYGKVYTFAISTSKDNWGESDKSNTKEGYLRLDSAYDLTASKDEYEKKIALEWKTVTYSGATSYQIYRTTTKDSLNFTHIASVDTTSGNSYSYIDDKGLSGDYKYLYKVKAFRSDFYSKQPNDLRFSNVDTGWLEIQAPIFTRASLGTSPDSIGLYFEKNSSGRYNIYYKTSNNGTESLFKTIENTDAKSLGLNNLQYNVGAYKGATSPTVIYVDTGQVIYFALSTVGTRESKLTEFKPGFTKLPAPTFSTGATKGEVDNIEVKWDKVSAGDNNIYYQITRTTTQNEDTTFEVGVTDRLVDNKNIREGFKYTYRIRAINRTAEDQATETYGTTTDLSGTKSAWSDTTTGYSKLLPVENFRATGPSGTAVDEKVVLSWANKGTRIYCSILRTLQSAISWDTIASGLINVGTYTDETAKDNILYYYKMQIYSEDYSTIFVECDSVAGYVKPSPPENVEASKAEYMSEIKISWSKVGLATSYQICRYIETGDSAFYTKNNSDLTISNDTVYLVEGNVEKGRYYTYKVKGILADGSETEYSDISTEYKKTKATGYTKLPAVTGIKATDGKYEDSVVVTWDSLAVAETYLVQRSKIGATSSTDTILQTVSINRLVDKKRGNFVDGEKYEYRVAAQKGTNLSNNWQSLFDEGYLWLSGPTGVTASQNLKDSIVIAWDSLTTVSDITKFMVYEQAREDGEDDILIGEVLYPGIQRIVYNVSDDKKGAVLKFYVTAVSTAFGTSAKSKEATGYTCLDTLSNFIVSGSSTERTINLSWVASKNSDSTILSKKNGSVWEEFVTLPSSTLSWRDTSLKVGKRYYYRAQAKKSDGSGITIYSPFVYADTLLIIPTISFDTITKGDYLSQVKLTWDGLSSKDELRFQIFVYQTKNDYNNETNVYDTLAVEDNGKEYYSFMHNSVTASDGKFMTGTKYFYKIRTQTVSGGGWSALTMAESTKPSYGWTKTPSPTITSVSKDSIGAIYLRWIANSAAKKFDIQRTFAYPGKEDTKIIPANDTFKRDDVELFTGHEYSYKVRAVNEDCENDTSEWTSQMIGIAKLLPPEGVTVTQGTVVDTIVVTWNMPQNVSNPSYGATKYVVYRSETKDASSMSHVGDTILTDWNSSSRTKISFSNVLSTKELGKLYYYGLRAAVGAEQSELSIIDSGWAKIPAPTFTAYTAKDGGYRLKSDSIRITWSDPCVLNTSSTKYELQRKLDGSVEETISDIPFAIKDTTWFVDTTNRYKRTTVRIRSKRSIFGESVWSDWIETYTAMPTPDIKKVVTDLTTEARKVRINYICPEEWVDTICFYREISGMPNSSTLIYKVANAGQGKAEKFYDSTNICLGVKYGYRVRYYKEITDLSEASEDTCITIPVLPPENLVATQGTHEDKIMLTWTGVQAGAGITVSYNVYVDSNSTGEFTNYTNINAETGQRITGNGGINNGFTATNPEFEVSYGTSFPEDVSSPWFNLVLGRNYKFAVTTNMTKEFTNTTSNLSTLSNTVIGYARISKPKTISASKGTDEEKITLKWRASKAYNHDEYVTYQIYRTNQTTGITDSESVINIEGLVKNGDTLTCKQKVGLEAKVKYSYKIKALMGSNGEVTTSHSSLLSTDSVVGWLALPSPKNFSASNGLSTDSIYLRWSNPSNLTTQIYACDSLVGLWDNQIITVVDSQYSVPINNNDDRGIYKYYGARFYHSVFGTSNISSTCQDSGYALFTGVAIKSVSEGEYLDTIKIVWDTFKNATSYDLQYIEKGAPSDWSTKSAIRGNKYSISGINGVSRGVLHYIRVRAANKIINRSGDEGYGTVDSGFTQLDSVGGFSATKGDLIDTIRLNWSRVNNAEYYSVYRSENNSNFVCIDTTENLLYKDNTQNLIYGKTYYYKMLAVNKLTVDLVEKYKNYSPIDSGWMEIPVPQNVTATKGKYDNKVIISWTPINRVEGYVIDTAREDNTSLYARIDTVLPTSQSEYHAYVNELSNGQLERGVRYFFKVRAFTQNRKNTIENANQDNGYISLKAPENLVASKGTSADTITLSFNVANNLTTTENYLNCIQRKSKSTGDTSYVMFDANTFIISSNSVIIYDKSSLQPNEDGYVYSYRAMCKKGEITSGWSSWSDYGWINLRPLEITVANEQDSLMTDSIKISWDKSASQFNQVNQLKIYYDTMSEPTNGWQSVLVLDKATELNKGYLMINTQGNSNFSAGTMYYFRAKSCYYEDAIEITSAFSALDSGWYKLRAPIITYSSVGESPDSITIRWSAQSDLPHGSLADMQYIIKRGSTDRYKTLSNNQTYFHDTTGVEEGSVFTYTVRAKHSKYLESEPSRLVYGYARLIPPVMVGVEAVDDSMKITWTYQPAKLATIDSFYVYKKESYDGVESSPIIRMKVTSSPSYTYYDKNCELGKKYYYYVRAHKEGMNLSDTSAVGSGVLSLTEPTIDTVSRGAYTNKIDIEWTGTAYSEQYVIIRGTENTFDPADTIDTVKALPTKYTDENNLIDGTVYYYKIMAKRGEYLSEESGYMAGYTKLKKPSIENITQNTEKIAFKWNHNGGNSPRARVLVGEDIQVLSVKDSAHMGEDSTSDLVSLFTERDTWFVKGKEYYVKLKTYKPETRVMKQSVGQPESIEISSDYSEVKMFYTNISQPSLTIISDKLDTLTLRWDRIDRDVVRDIAVQWTRNGFGASIDTFSTNIVNKGTDSIGNIKVAYSGDATLQPGVKYTFRIMFKRGSVTSVWSDVAKGWTKLPAPINFSASKGVYDDSIRFTWDNYRENTDTLQDNTYRYVIEYHNGSEYRSMVGGTITDKKKFYNVTLPMTGIVTKGVMGQFRIRGEGNPNLDYSISYQSTNLSSDSGHTRLMIPISGGDATKDEENKIILNWYTTIGEDTTAYKNLKVKYQIERRKSADDFVGNILASVDTLTQAIYTDRDNLDPRYIYYYRIRFYSEVYFNRYSNDSKSSSPWYTISDSGSIAINPPTIKAHREEAFYTDRVELDIERSLGSDSVYLYRETNSSGQFILVDTVVFDDNVTTQGAYLYYKDTISILSGNRYTYRGVSVNGARTSNNGSEFRTYTRLETPASLTVSDGEYDNKVVAEWDTVRRADGYCIWVYKVDDGSFVDSVAISNQAKTKNLVKDQPLRIVVGERYTFKISAYNENCIKPDGTKIYSEQATDKGFLKFVLPEPVTLSRDSVGFVKIEVGYSASGFTLDVYRSPDTATVSETQNRYDKYSKIDVSATYDSTRNVYVCKDILASTSGIPGVRYNYMVQIYKSGMKLAISDTFKTFEKNQTGEKYGWGKAEAYNGILYATQGASQDSIVINWKDTEEKKYIDSVAYQWVEYDVSSGDSLFSSIISDTILIRYAQSRVDGNNSVKNGYKYKYKIRKKFYDATNSLYTTSDLSINSITGWATMEKPSINLTVTDAGDFVVSQRKNNNVFKVYKKVNGISESAEHRIDQGEAYIDSVLYNKQHNIGKK